MTEVHSIWMHNNWRSQCGWEGSRAIPEIGEGWLSQAGWSTFLHFKWFFALFVGCFLFYWGILFLVLRNFPPFSRVQGQTCGCAAHSLPRWCSTLPQAPLPMLCPEPLPHQPLILMGLWWHQVVTHQISELQLGFQSQRTSFWWAFVYPCGARTGRGHFQRLSPLAAYMKEPTKFPSATSPWSKMSCIWLKHPIQETWTDVSTSSSSPSLCRFKLIFGSLSPASMVFACCCLHL